MELLQFFEKAKKQKGKVINIADILAVSKDLDCRRVIVAVYLVKERLITVGEAVEGLKKESNFFILSH